MQNREKNSISHFYPLTLNQTTAAYNKAHSNYAKEKEISSSFLIWLAEDIGHSCHEVILFIWNFVCLSFLPIMYLHDDKFEYFISLKCSY